MKLIFSAYGNYGASYVPPVDDIDEQERLRGGPVDVDVGGPFETLEIANQWATERVRQFERHDYTRVYYVVEQFDDPRGYIVTLDLEKRERTAPAEKTAKWPWIVGGIFALGAVGLVIWGANRRTT